MSAHDEYVYSWGNNERRAELKGRHCVVEARGAMRTVLVRFLDTGERVTTSERALRPVVQDEKRPRTATAHSAQARERSAPSREAERPNAAVATADGAATSWWRAEKRGVVFAFALVATPSDGLERVGICAPIGRRWLMGRTRDQARAALTQRGYTAKMLK